MIAVDMYDAYIYIMNIRILRIFVYMKYRKETDDYRETHKGVYKDIYLLVIMMYICSTYAYVRARCLKGQQLNW